MLFKIVLSVLFSTVNVEKPVDKVLLTCGNLMINVLLRPLILMEMC